MGGKGNLYYGVTVTTCMQGKLWEGRATYTMCDSNYIYARVAMGGKGNLYYGVTETACMQGS